jgi:putative flippase GtrA
MLSPGVRRFLRFSVLSGITFGFDLGLLYVLTSWLAVPYYFSTPAALLVAVSINYLLVRTHVFKGTERRADYGYAIYILLALGGAAFVTFGVTLLVAYVHLYYLLARIIVGVFSGVANYFLNLYFNFRVAGKHE